MRVINLRDREYKIHIDFQALADLEVRSNKSITEFKEIISSLNGIKLLLFCALQRYHGNIFPEPNDLDGELGLESLEYLTGELAAEFNNSFTGSAENAA